MKTDKELKRISKFLSLVLRHKPEEAELTLDEEGYADVKVLCKNIGITMSELINIVETDNKQRFSFNLYKEKIRANQGHSLDNIDLKLTELNINNVPEFLYHGTSKELLSIICKEGLKKMKRQYVHISFDQETANNVGSRHSKDIIIFKINAKLFVSQGNKLYISENKVYLTDYVDPKYFNGLFLNNVEYYLPNKNGRMYGKEMMQQEFEKMAFKINNMSTYGMFGNIDHNKNEKN